MENLTINDPSQQLPPQLGQGGGPAPPPGAGGPLLPGPPSQLPPQMFTTAAQLLDLTDKKLMVTLRDGRKLIGVLRSWDQFANLVLQSTVERIYTTSTTPRLYADVPRGVFLVRGENVLLLGEIDLDKDDIVPAGYKQGDVDEVHALAKKEAAERKVKDKVRLQKLHDLGFEGENSGEILL